MRRQIQIANNYAFILFMASLPFHRVISSYLLGIWIIASLLSIEKKDFNSKLQTIAIWSVLPLLFLSYSVSLFYTDNIELGINKISASLSLLIIPFVFYINRNKIDLKTFSKTFIWSVFSTGILSVLNIIFNSETINWASFYLNFSLFQHPTYFALLNLLAIALIAIVYKNLFLRLTLLVWFSMMIYFVSSKAGIMALLMIFALFVISEMKNKFKLRHVILLLLFITSSFVLLKMNERVHNMISNIENLYKSENAIYATESTSIRWVIFNNNMKVIAQNPILGYGIGDANEALQTELKKEAYLNRHVIKRKYNAHNAFMQTWLYSGLPGFLLLILSLILPIIVSPNKLFSVIITCIFCFNFLFESILDRQTGIMLYCTFMSLLVVDRKRSFFQYKYPNYSFLQRFSLLK